MIPLARSRMLFALELRDCSLLDPANQTPVDQIASVLALSRVFSHLIERAEAKKMNAPKKGTNKTSASQAPRARMSFDIAHSMIIRSQNPPSVIAPIVTNT